MSLEPENPTAARKSGHPNASVETQHIGVDNKLTLENLKQQEAAHKNNQPRARNTPSPMLMDYLDHRDDWLMYWISKGGEKR